jgi:hypothetical protein
MNCSPGPGPQLIRPEGPLNSAYAMVDWMRDTIDIWDEVPQSHRLECAREFVSMCQDMEGYGYLCHLGRYKQQLKTPGKPALVIDVALMSFLPKKDGDGTRYCLIRLEGAWETLAEDRVELPPNE